MHMLSCRHANQEEKSEIRNRLEGLKKGMAVFSSTPTHTVQNEDVHSPRTRYVYDREEFVSRFPDCTKRFKRLDWSVGKT